MPTIRQMYAGTYNFYRTTYQNGQLFRHTANSSAKNTSNNFFSGFSSNYRDLLSTYNTTKNTFNTEFDETISNLKNSAGKIKNFDFNAGENAVTRTENISEDGEKIISTKYNDKMTDALKTVENFLSDYNDTINFFSENSSISRRVGNMAKSFSDTTYLSKIYDSVGVVTNSDGTMKIDEEKLVNAIEKNPDKVSRIFGSLASKAEAHISTANARKNTFFPTAKNMLGMNFNSGLYGKNNFLNSYLNTGNFLNLMF